MEQSDNGRPVANIAEEAQEERKRYVTRLQRRAQSQIANDLSVDSLSGNDDAEIATLIKQALEEMGARRVSLFRPVARGQRWHVTTALAEGGHYYGLVPPESVVLPMVSFSQRKTIVWSATGKQNLSAPRPDEFGYRSYVGVPLVNDGVVSAIVEAVDFAKPDEIDRFVTVIEQRFSSLGRAGMVESARATTVQPESVPTHGLTEASVLDLVLRPPYESDAVIEISPQELQLITHLNGDRSLSETATAAGLAASQAITLAAKLLDRGLVKVGRENRRRG